MSRRGVSGWMLLLVPAHPGNPGQRAVKWSCVCVCVCGWLSERISDFLFSVKCTLRADFRHYVVSS